MKLKSTTGCAVFFAALSAATSQAECTDIYAFEVQGVLAEGDAVLVDVREPYEYRDCRIPGSVNVPLSELPKEVGRLEGKKTVILYCRTGGRSSRACKELENRGFERVYNLSGGITAWYNTSGDLEGDCEGRPYFQYGKDGKVVKPEFSRPLPEPEVKGCK